MNIYFTFLPFENQLTYLYHLMHNCPKKKDEGAPCVTNMHVHL